MHQFHSCYHNYLFASGLLEQHTYVVPTFHYVDLNSSDRDHQVCPAASEQFVFG